MRQIPIVLAFAAAALAAAPVSAQDVVQVAENSTPDSASAEKTAAPAPASASLLRPIELQHVRPMDKRGINQFETTKEPGVPFQGFRISWGAAFTQQFQGLSHENTATARVVNNVDLNSLMPIANGFNNAVANLYLGAQLAPGIRVAMTSYLSSRHHQETWVKDGYLLIDASPIKVAPLENLMKYVTIKAGHFEVNYGDGHFRRTDNGMALFNPFVGNYIMDAFTTEIGGEVYVRARGAFVMGAVTGGEIRGTVQTPGSRSPSYIGKIGVDRQLNPDVRVRLTGSAYKNYKSASNTLFGGDRAGSRYYMVLENPNATTNGNFTSGLLNPGFRNDVAAFQVNPFIKFRGLEFFGLNEMAKGRTLPEKDDRTMHQRAADLVYRFFNDESLYLGARWNQVDGALKDMPAGVTITRQALATGWFVTPGVLLKGELVEQKYTGFPANDIRNGGKFKGFLVEGVVAF